MKKLTLLAIILIATSMVAMAQPRAIGGRIGWETVGVSFQHYMGEKSMIQADLDILGYYRGLQGTATYNWIFPIKTWSGGDFNAFAGVGVGGGYFWHNWGGRYRCWGGHSAKNQYGIVGVAGNVGLEVNFKFGLQLSLDYRPLIGPYFAIDGESYIHHNGTLREGNEGGYYIGGLWTGAAAIGVRYKFGK